MNTLRSYADRDALVAIEQKALKLQANRDWAGAAKLWKELLAHDPEWEHGDAHMSLASCHEELGEFEKARGLYLRAIELEPSEIHIGSFASFLYLHGEPEEAFDAHLQLLQLESRSETWPEGSDLEVPIRELGNRLGLSSAEVERRINDARGRGSRGEPNMFEKTWDERYTQVQRNLYPGDTQIVYEPKKPE